jgi:hypothetical protein
MRKVIAKIALAGVPVLMALAVAAPASAAPSAAAGSPAACPAGNLCFWSDAGYGGAMGKVAGNNGSWTKFPESACATKNWSDCASSIYNHGSFDSARVFHDINGKGGGRCLPIGTKWDNLTDQFFDNGVKMNDAISSNDWITSACS